MADLSGSHITLTPVNMTNGMKVAVQNAHTRIDELLAGQNGLNDAVEAELIAVKQLISNLETAGNADVTELTNKINLLGDVFSKTGEANDAFDALFILANAWNSGGDMTSSVEVDFNSATGELAVDLTSFGFADTTAYKLLGAIDSKGAGLVRAGFVKESGTSAKVVCWDAKYFVEDAVKYDASGVDANFGVTVGVQYTRPTLSFTLTDEEGNETTV